MSSLPLTDFQFTMSLSHDVPLATTLGQCIYVLGSIQRTGEKLLLQYNTKKGAYIWKKATKLSKRNLVLFSAQKAHSYVCCCLENVFGSPALDLHLQAVHWFINGSFEFFLSLLDVWSELLPTLTRASVDLPTLYFLGATDRLLVIGGNNSENVVTSFCAESQKWGPVNNQQTHTHIRRALDYLDA